MQQKSAWMDQTIYTGWFHKVFVRQVKVHLVENTKHGHSKTKQEDDGLFCLIFF